MIKKLFCRIKCLFNKHTWEFKNFNKPTQQEIEIFKKIGKHKKILKSRYECKYCNKAKGERCWYKLVKETLNKKMEAENVLPKENT